MALLWMGFNETGMCGGGSEAFRKVISTGERLISGALDSRTAGEVHRLVGDAYADIVSLAAGAPAARSLTQPTTSRRQQPPAGRQSRITGQAFVIEHDSPEARAAWLEAWRLLAGLPPSTTYFVCVYD